MNKKIKPARSLEELLAAANAAFDEQMAEEANMYREQYRYNFIVGYLGAAYESLLEKCTKRKC